MAEVNMSTAKEILKRGRVYRCLLCDKQEGEKRYVISHIYKYHIPLDSIPYYCSLCHFQTDEENKLKEHVKSYSRHQEARDNLVRLGRQPGSDETYLQKNRDGIIPKEDQHFERLGKEESRKVWLDRLKGTSKAAAAPTPQPLSHNSPIVVTPPVLPSTVTSVTCNTQSQVSNSAFQRLQPTPTFPDLLQLDDVDPELFSFLGEPLQQQTTATPICLPPEKVEGATIIPTQTTSATEVGGRQAPRKSMEKEKRSRSRSSSSFSEDEKESTKRRARTRGRAEPRERSRSRSQTRLMYDIVGHLFNVQRTLQNIHHEMQTQTDILKGLRDQYQMTRNDRQTTRNDAINQFTRSRSPVRQRNNNQYQRYQAPYNRRK